MKSKSELQIERMWFLECGTTHSCEFILNRLYCVQGWSIGKIATYYVQSYGTIQGLLKKYKIEKEIVLV